MNKIIITPFLILAILFSNCKFKTQAKTPIAKQPILVICIGDQSLSSQYADKWDSVSIAQLYNNIAINGGGIIKYFAVLSNSQFQTGYSVKIPVFDTLAYKGSIYKTGKAKEKNRNTKESYLASSSKDISALVSKVVQPQKEKFSDIYGCLKLCLQTSQQSNFSEYSIHIIIVSDLLHDQPKNRKSKVIQSFQFPDNARVLLVRPMLSEKSIKQLFAETPVEVYTSLQDAISTISSN